ncbi:MAG TPA: ATP-binding protein [Caulobacteraceae bacterium]|jgi:CheY-like chemotaxis protein
MSPVDPPTDAAPSRASARDGDAQSLRQQTEHLAAISHQIRSPLNGVLALADLLSKQPLPGDGPSYVRTIRDSVEHVVGILSEAIDHYRTECVGMELSPAPSQLRGLMDDIQALWLAPAQQVGVSLNVSFEGGDDAVLIDAARLKQVFGNLIGNALKFTRRGGIEASLRVVQADGRARLRGLVRDTGPGIAPEKLATIFEPFLQDARGEQTGETGLGLSICRQVMQAMGGRIWAEANRGAGAVFYFELEAPIARAQAPAPGPAEEPAMRGHVLIVDDNRMNRMVAEKLCESFGCTTETAEDGVEAVEAVRARPFDLVLMDIKMPRMDGVQATRAIRALPGPQRDLPIIALTANPEADDGGFGAAGMGWIVGKPIRAELLFEAMRAALAPPAEAAPQGDVAAA